MHPMATPVLSQTTSARPLRATIAERGKARVAAVGVTGYAGGELLRLLAAHPAVEISAIVGRGRSREPIAKSQPHLVRLGLEIREDVPDEVDVVFLALPHGA